MLTKKIVNSRINLSLVRYPIIKKHLYKDIDKTLSKNYSISRLLENSLIRSLYQRSANLDRLEEYLYELSDKVNIETAIKLLRNNFLDKYSSFFYELDTAHSLVSRGESNVEFIPTNSHGKTPDLEYINKQGKKCFVEVKGFESVNPEFSIINDKLKARAILDDFYKKTFLIEPKIDYISLKKANDIKIELEKSFKNLLDEIKETYTAQEKKEQFFKYGNISYEYKIFENKSKICLPMLHGGGDWNILTQRPIFMMTSIYSRIFTKFHQAYEQLLCHRKYDYNLVKDDSIFMYVNLNGSLKSDNIKKINEVINTAGLNEFVNVIVK